MARPSLPALRECRYIPLDPPECHTPAQVDCVGLIKQLFFLDNPEQFTLTVRRSAYFDTLAEPTLRSSSIRSNPLEHFGLH